MGIVQSHEVKIKLSENKYISKKPYRCSIIDQKEIELQLANLLKKQLIENSSSPFVAPVTLAYKKDDGRKTRLCIDFRELNKMVLPEPQPFPRIDDVIVKAGNCEWFSTLDVNSAFWSIPIREKDKIKTAFVTQNGHYQWTCHPFGLKTSPAIFQRIFRQKSWNHYITYCRKMSNSYWTEKCEEAFNNVKSCLCSSSILSIYDQNKPVYWSTLTLAEMD